MTELEAARQIRDGKLPSPWPMGGMTLFALRITGTGLSYRSGHDEFVWRDSSIYLNDEFLARCNGLPVIWEHPEKKPALDSKEYNDRSIGTVMLPYIKGDEVWGVCRLYDADAITLMTEGKLSTSPAVVFSAESGNKKYRSETGEVLLIEGDPPLLDSLAVCAAGVWDKGGPPTGVQNDALPPPTETERVDSMAESETEKKEREEREDAARKDAAGKLDAMMDSVSKMHARLDAMEMEDKARKDAAAEAEKDKARHDAARKDRFGHRKDGEKRADWAKRHDADEAAMAEELEKGGSEKDKARKDAKDCRMDSEETERKDGGESFEKWAKEEGDEPEHKDAKKDGKDEKMAGEHEKQDAARHDATTAELATVKAALAALQGQMKVITSETTVEDRNALATAQARADGIAGLFGNRALPPIPGENPIEYRRRLANAFKQHSPRFKAKSLAGFDADVLEMAEEVIYADAATASRAPDRAGAGVLIPITEPDAAGRQITRYVGDNLAWMSPFMTGGQVGRIIRPSRGA